MAISPEYSLILNQAKAKRKENKSFLDRIKKSRPADLDETTNRFQEEAFQKIDCLKCANCCSTTSPLLKNRDIDLLAANQKVRPSVFADTYLKTDEDGDYVFKQTPCPFLGSDNLCSVYSCRPKACREYPHTQQRDILKKLPITWHNSMICPAVALIVEDLKKYYLQERR
jgi:Fe-S-cluster containining protein